MKQAKYLPNNPNQEKYKERLIFEHELINRRLTWLLTSQSILFAALAFVFNNNDLDSTKNVFSEVLPLLGMCISIAILIGIIMGITAKIIAWQDSKKAGAEYFGVRPWITLVAFIPDLVMPIAFAIAWYCLSVKIG